jgi:biopolymer transport protein ExbD
MLEEMFISATDKKLYLRADSDLEYGKLVEVYEFIRGAGIESIAVIADKKTEKGD